MVRLSALSLGFIEGFDIEQLVRARVISRRADDGRQGRALIRAR